MDNGIKVWLGKAHWNCAHVVKFKFDEHPRIDQATGRKFEWSCLRSTRMKRVKHFCYHARIGTNQRLIKTDIKQH